MAFSITKVVQWVHFRASRNYGTDSQNKIWSTISENKNTGNIVKHMREVIDDVLSQHKPCQEIPGLASYLKRAAEYTTIRGKKFKYAMTVNAYDITEDPELKSKETLNLAQIIGMCWELINSCFLISDDLEDSSLFRHDQPCWYTLPGVGVNVGTDVALIRGLQQEILKKWFHHQPQRSFMLELFDEVYFYSAIGQYLDRVTSQVRSDDFSSFTMEQWETLIKYKAGYSFYGPIYSGLALTMKSDLKQRKEQVIQIARHFGYIFTMQNDFHDAYADFVMLRKEGVDIKEGKCTWLAVNALQLATPAQRTVFIRNYGKAEIDHVTKIKELYNNLQLNEVFVKALKKQVQETRRLIDRLPDDRMKIMLMDIVDAMSKDVYAYYVAAK